MSNWQSRISVGPDPVRLRTHNYGKWIRKEKAGESGQPVHKTCDFDFFLFGSSHIQQSRAIFFFIDFNRHLCSVGYHRLFINTHIRCQCEWTQRWRWLLLCSHFISCSYSIFMISIDQYIFSLHSILTLAHLPPRPTSLFLFFIFSLMRFSECNSHTCLHFNRLSQPTTGWFCFFLFPFFSSSSLILISLFEISTVAIEFIGTRCFFYGRFPYIHTQAIIRKHFMPYHMAADTAYTLIGIAVVAVFQVPSRNRQHNIQIEFRLLT